MSEVWIFRGTQPVLWRIPVRVTMRKPTEGFMKWRQERFKERAHFEPAVPLLSCIWNGALT